MERFKVIAGPCVVESLALLDETCSELKRLSIKYDFELIFKSSYKKANRTSLNSFTGLGDEIALNYLKQTAEKYDVPCISDVHETLEVEMASHYLDYLQIPAFLARQTDLLIAAGKSGKHVNIKKGQFMAPEDMEKAANKVKSTGNNNVLLTERGTFFGYNNLVVDFRSIPIMKKFNCPIIYDATHSVQKPSLGDVSGGSPEFIYPLAKAAIAVGIDGIFVETHPNPEKAMSDAASQLKLQDFEQFISNLLVLHKSILTIN